MALFLSKKAKELVTFYQEFEGETFTQTVEREYIDAMQMLVKPGEAAALSQRHALQLMKKTDTDSHRRQWRAAADYWQTQGVFVGATEHGYFRVTNEFERDRCLRHKQKAIKAQRRRIDRLTSLEIGKRFP